MGIFSAWFFYGLHQLTMWGLIFYAQRSQPKYRHTLHEINWWALGLNGFFCLLHIVQTHIWYDGLAQHVSIWSALVSVAIMLIWVLLMETPRRGLFFGKKPPFSKSIIRAAKKYHGYYFSWAIIYTFWYHPTEATWGHLMGFSYIFVLLLQGSLFLHPISPQSQMDALVGNVGDRARYHRRVRKPTQYLGHVLFWFFGHFHHHPDARFKLHYIAKVGIYPVVPCRC